MTKDVSEEANEDTASPASTVRVGVRRPKEEARPNARAIAASAPRKAANGSKSAAPSKRTDTAANEAPELTPRRYGSASGFLVSACMTTPPMASPAPTTAAVIILGSRSSHMIAVCTCLSGSGVPAAIRSIAEAATSTGET